MQRAVLVAGAIHGMLDEVTGSIDAAFVQLQVLEEKKKSCSFDQFVSLKKMT